MNFILINKLKVDTKDIFKIFSFITITFELVCAILIITYKPTYSVIISNQEIGYIENKANFEEMINTEILQAKAENIENISLNTQISYKFKFINKNKKTNESEILSLLMDNATITYKYYSIAINGENELYTNTIEEAEQIINSLKDNNIDTTDLDIKILDNYTTNKDEYTIEPIETAKQIILEKSKIKKEEIKEQKRIEGLPSINGIKLAVVPVSGTISSRYGAPRSGSHAHTGLDIYATYGSDIKAAADGTVCSAGYESSYGNIVRIDHGNGVVTCYAHSSKINVTVGQTVKAGDVIAQVGSTGNSTGPHLHFEVRLNGSTLNPEKYIF